MKKILTSMLAMLLLLSGMHLSVASHYCGGTLAKVEWSFNRELASCGMEGEHHALQGITIEQPCCQDELATYTTDGQYQIQSFELNKFSPQVIAQFAEPIGLHFKSQSPVDFRYTHVFPPGEVLSSQVLQENICVFII
ncbi:MAG TPA: hypothetical protein VFP20_09460 [Bacteroidales bacterium]|nr:hypothetical protein [Bacteroidales bacterium]